MNLNVRPLAFYYDTEKNKLFIEAKLNSCVYRNMRANKPN